MKRTLCLLFMLILEGCDTNYPPANKIVEEQPRCPYWSGAPLMKVSDEDLCMAYGGRFYETTSKPIKFFGHDGDPCKKSGEIRTELKRRNLFDKRQWKAIEQVKIYISMPKLALLASWGQPYDKNQTVIRGYTSEQWVYCEYCTVFPASHRTYVYLENDRISAWQN